MKNLKYFPFERNHYYNGKLLSEQDFIKEQQYMNDKRRLQNRFLYGQGVVAGLRTLMVNERSLSVEDGVALDFAGREIVVPAPAVYKLSMLDGFQKMEEEYRADDVYLCIEYNENQHGQTPGMETNWDQQAQSFDKTKESYRLYLTDRAPEEYERSPEDFLIKTNRLFENDMVLVELLCYKAIVSNELFKISLRVVNKGNLAKFNIRVQATLDGAFDQEKALCEVSFDNLVLERGQEKEQIVTLRAKKLEYGTVSLQIDADSLRIQRNEQVLAVNESTKIEIPVVQENLIEFLKAEYFDQIMESIVTNNHPRGIYLAKIFLVRQDTSYMIERVQPMPFDQYVYSSFLMASIVKELERSVLDLKAQQLAHHNNGVVQEVQQGAPKTEYGVVEIPLNYSAKAGQLFQSKEIYHNLGMGVCDIQLSMREDDVLYSGDQDVFVDKKIKAKLAVKQEVGKGRFVIGLRLLETTDLTKAVVHYSVQATAQQAERQEGTIRIVPSKLELRQRESYSLEAVCDGIYGATILWNLSDPHAGTISIDGTYTAPNHEGVYEITATCEQKPSLRASLYVVVRE